MRLTLDSKPFQGVSSGVDQEGQHQPVGFWQETVSVMPGPPLAERLTCDVAIAGAGFTGLSAAYHLKTLKPELDVVVLEAGVAGHGASGRNGGFVMPLIGWDLLYAVEKLGEAAAGKAYRLMYRAVAHVKRMVAEHGIDCDLEATGYLLLNTCAARERRAHRELEAAHRLGFDHEWLEGPALTEHIRSEHFRSGVLDPHPCVVNPAKLARGMKALAESIGVRVYERSPLLELESGRPARLRTESGEVRATQALIALNGYGGALGFMPSRVLPIHTYIVLTEPLSAEQLDAVGWGKHRTSLESSRNFIHYFRLTADNRILFGGEDATMYYGGRYRDRDDKVFQALKDRFHEYFPALRGAQFTHAWGGVLGVSLDMFPSFGEQENIFHAGAYSGHGVALSNYAGAILAPRMLRAAGVADAPDPEPDNPFFYGRRPTWMGVDPVRYLGVQAYRYLLRGLDRIQGA